ncbi:MAG: L,D-transpeptidase [Gammaproteobacteria bacterium]|nr:L,D-transpeptidase [Gammaproteobacteria bacterium]
MNKLQNIFVLLSVFFAATSITWAGGPLYYGPNLCKNAQFKCIKVQKGQSWKRLFPDNQDRDLVQRLNRTYNSLWAGKVIVVPRNLNELTILDISPFPRKMDTQEKQIIVDQDKLAWGAYDEHGKLLNWGPIASGRDKCPDSSKSCKTMSGIFRMFSKENSHCSSDVYPVGRGGAPMPYCMYFHKGFAMHGSNDIPGYRASHGCVRMFTRDAKWLNEEFVEISTDENNQKGTKVIVRPSNSVGRTS